MGANPKSFFFYSQVKGKMEEELQKLVIGGIHIFRPSLLVGNRQNFVSANEWLKSYLVLFRLSLKELSKI